MESQFLRRTPYSQEVVPASHAIRYFIGIAFVKYLIAIDDHFVLVLTWLRDNFNAIPF